MYRGGDGLLHTDIMSAECRNQDARPGQSREHGHADDRAPPAEFPGMSTPPQTPDPRPALTAPHLRGRWCWRLLPLAAALLAWLPMAQSGLLANGDWHVHLFRLDGFLQGIAEWRLRPLWHADANAGYGAPTFLFYQPVAYYLATLLNSVVGDPVDALKLVMLLALIGTAEGSWRLFRARLDAPAAALLAAAVVLSPATLLPVHQFFMPSHALGFMFVPWLLLALGVLDRDPRRGALATGVVLGLQIPTHPLMAMLSVGLMVCFVLAALWKGQARRLAPAVVGGLIMAAALSAWHWLPVALMRELVHWEYLLNPAWSWRHNLLFERATPPFGAFHDYRLLFDVLAAAVIATMAAAVAVLMLRRRRLSTMALASILAFVVVLALCTPVGAWLVEWIPPLGYLQFAWRCLAPLQLLACLVLAEALAKRGTSGIGISSTGDRWVRRAASLPLLVVVPLAWPVAGLQPAPSWTGLETQRLDSNRVAGAAQEEVWSTLEMRPKAMGSAWRNDLSRDPLPLLHASSSRFRAGSVVRTQHGITVRFDARSATELRIRHLYFPGWRATVDGTDMPIVAEPGSAAMRLTVPRDSGELRLVYTPVIEVVAAAWISALAWLLLVAGLLVAAGRRRVTP